MVDFLLILEALDLLLVSVKGSILPPVGQNEQEEKGERMKYSLGTKEDRGG